MKNIPPALGHRDATFYPLVLKNKLIPVKMLCVFLSETKAFFIFAINL
jgi:hypothetical protein